MKRYKLFIYRMGQLFFWLLPPHSSCRRHPVLRKSAAASGSGSSVPSAIIGYFADWFPRVTRIQSEQPHWVTPIVAVTPRLEEEFRDDQFWQANPYGQATDNFCGGKGL